MKFRIYKHEMRQLNLQRFNVRLIDFVSLQLHIIFNYLIQIVKQNEHNLT